MVTGGNADSKPSEKKMQGEESVRTIDCLRGRLLAERLASKNAKENADQLENKLIELESLLKEEAKSRNRAEKRLKYLMKKLESMNISQVSDLSEHSGLVDRSDISSVSSRTSSITKSPQEKTLNPQLKVTTSEGSSISESEVVSLPQHKGQECEMGLNDTTFSSTDSDNFQEDVAKSTSTDDEKTNKNEHSGESSNEGEYDQDRENQIDNSMALVLVETPPENEQKIDPEILDATVKEVLDALTHAKQQLQNSMERRRRVNMIRVSQISSVCNADEYQFIVSPVRNYQI